MSVLLLLSLGCVPEPPPPTTVKDPVVVPEGHPAISLVFPESGAGTYDGSIDLQWTVTDLTLDVEGMGGEPVPGEGHVHVYVDDVLAEETASNGARVTGLSAGPHTVVVRLAGNDHEELDVRDSVEIVAAFPSLSIVSPPDGGTLASSSTPLGLVIDGFTLVDGATENVFAQGRFTISIDGELRDWGADPIAAAATGLTEGPHTVRVELVTNDGQPLETPVYAERRVVVLPGARGVYFDRAAFAEPYDSATLPVSLTTTAFTLVDGDDTLLPVDGQGHFHWYMDGLWLDRGIQTSQLLQNMAPGPHLFEVRLVSNDGFELPIADRLRLTIAEDRPDAVISYPGDDWRMGPDFNLSFSAENFTFDAAAMDGANAPHVGHAQVWLDGVLVHETTSGIAALTALPVGTHVVRVQLANNDRTPVSPAVYQEIAVIVDPTL
ncbi:MAG: hypothetical protein Q8P41_31220 [Pseudomonadota bacterium]|nr:hypothetical protein [Pseudomonadota bacterium]